MDEPSKPIEIEAAVNSELNYGHNRHFLTEDAARESDKEQDVSSDDLPVVSVMPAMTLHEVED